MLAAVAQQTQQPQVLAAAIRTAKDYLVAANERQAKNAATDQLINHALENLTGVEAKWLEGVKPFFARIIAAAEDQNLSDADFVKFLESAQRKMPELFSRMDSAAVAQALEETMGAAAVNGAVKGAMQRRVGKKKPEVAA